MDLPQETIEHIKKQLGVQLLLKGGSVPVFLRKHIATCVDPLPSGTAHGQGFTVPIWDK